MRDDLATIARRCGTDKGDAHSYIPIYEEAFGPIRFRPLVLLEIGIFMGDSLRMWSEYFPNAAIIGVDVNPEYVQHAAPIRFCGGILCDVADKAALDLATAGMRFDIVIDDGSHLLEQQLAALEVLMSKMMPGGLYYVEDITRIEDVERFAVWRPTVYDLRDVRGRSDDVLLLVRPGA
jgi:cephalosporin hydroxylase